MEISIATMFFLDKNTGKLMYENSLVNGETVVRSFNKPVDELRKHPIRNNSCKITKEYVEWQGHTWNDFEEFIEYVEIAVLRSKRLEITELDQYTEQLLMCSPEHRREILQQYREKYEQEKREEALEVWKEAQLRKTKNPSENGGTQLGE